MDYHENCSHWCSHAPYDCPDCGETLYICGSVKDPSNATIAQARAERMLLKCPQAVPLSALIDRLSPRVKDDLRAEIAVACWTYGQCHHISPQIMVGLIKVESDFDFECHGAAGEVGLTQQLYRGSWDATQNIRQGFEELSRWLERVPSTVPPENRMAYGLAMYNGGWRGPKMRVCQRYAERVLALAER